MQEFRWIRDYFMPLTQGQPDALDLRDDAAILSPRAGKDWIITTDTINESVHFLPHTPARLIAQKAQRVNLSDLAAKGATPYAYTLSLSLPRETTSEWVADFCAGLSADQSQFGWFLLGGDTTATHGPFSICVTAFGLVDSGKALLRSGAKAGDLLYVSGRLGDAFLGLSHASGSMTLENPSPYLARYHTPDPRIALGYGLRGIASACMDVSDGLLQDVQHLCRASQLGATIDMDHAPITPDARDITREVLLSAGDDYELLFTAAPHHTAQIQALAKNLDLRLCAIGEVHAHTDIVYRSGGTAFTPQRFGYQHF